MVKRSVSMLKTTGVMVDRLPQENGFYARMAYRRWPKVFLDAMLLFSIGRFSSATCTKSLKRSACFIVKR